jgi:hypothetical protein
MKIIPPTLYIDAYDCAMDLESEHKTGKKTMFSRDASPPKSQRFKDGDLQSVPNFLTQKKIKNKQKCHFCRPPRPQNQQKNLQSQKPVPLSPAVPIPKTQWNIGKRRKTDLWIQKTNPLKVAMRNQIKRSRDY